MVCTADRSRNNLDLLTVYGIGGEVIVVQRSNNIGNLIKTVFRDVVKTTNEGADVASASAGSQNGLRNAEAQRHVHRNALGCKCMRCGKAFHHGGDLHNNVRSNCGKLATVGDELFARHSNRFCGNGAIRANDVADALDVVVEVIKLAADARIQRRIGGYASQRTPACCLFDLIEIGSVQKEFHWILLKRNE